MSEESTTPDPVERVRRQFEAANRRDLDAVMSSFAVDAVLEGGRWGTSSKAKRQFVPSLRAGSACMRNWSSSLRRSTTSATELCLLWSSKRLGLLASPVTFSRERDGSTSGWEV